MDPVFLQSKRELKLTLAAWGVFGLWSVGVSWWLGRSSPVESGDVDTVLGMPPWVFWGVALPWLLANLVTVWFCFGFMEDAPLHVVEDERDDPTEATPENPGQP